MKKIWIIIYFVLAIPVASAFSGSSDDYNLYYGIDGMGLVEGSSADYIVRSNLLYQPVGKFTSTDYKLYLGPYYKDYLPLVIPDTTPPTIAIISPQNITYSTTTIELKVVADEEIDTWMYSLNGADNVTFTPNTTITAPEGFNELTVYAKDTSGNIGSEKVYFTVFIPTTTTTTTTTTTIPETVMRIIAPTNGATYSANYFWLINEVYIPYDYKAYSLDGGSWVTFSGNPKIYSSYGNHNIRMKVVAESGTYYSDTVYFTLRRRSSGGGGFARLF